MNELASLLRAASREASRGINTCLPGTIVSYDAGSQMASVQPMVRLRQPDDREEQLPVINSVPVIWPRSGGASMTMPVKSGDGCLLIFSQRSIDEYKSNGEMNTPQDPRMFDLTDAVAFMGFVNFGGGGGPADALQIKFGGSTILVKEDGVEISTSDVKVNAPLTTYSGNVTVQGSLTVQGNMKSEGHLNIEGPSVSHNGVNIGATHKHSGVESGSSDTAVPH